MNLQNQIQRSTDLFTIGKALVNKSMIKCVICNTESQEDCKCLKISETTCYRCLTNDHISTNISCPLYDLSDKFRSDLACWTCYRPQPGQLNNHVRDCPKEKGLFFKILLYLIATNLKRKLSFVQIVEHLYLYKDYGAFLTNLGSLWKDCSLSRTVLLDLSYIE